MSDSYKTRPCALCGQHDYEMAPETEQVFPMIGRAAVFICRSCGMTPYFATYELDNRALLENEYYADEGGEYSARRSDSQEAQYRGKVSATLTDLKKGLPADAELLDVGCGEGILLEEATKIGFKPVGIEPSHTEVQKLAARGFEVYQGLLEDNIGRFERRFDAVTLTWVMDCIMHPLPALQGLRRCMKHDGRLLIVQASKYMAPLYRHRYGLPVPHQKMLVGILPGPKTAYSHPYYYTQKTLLALLAVAGFQPVAVSPEDALQPELILRTAEPVALKDCRLENTAELRRYFADWRWRDRYYVPAFEVIMRLRNTLLGQR